ncbi:MAG: nucleoside-diphosphate kinase [Candidatus Pacearchaeota archaeon]
MVKERALLLIKPDGVKRGLIGKIISRFEEIGLKIIGMKMIQSNEELAKKHYPLQEEWIKQVYEKTKAVYEKENKEFKYKEPIELATTLQNRSVSFLLEGPVIAIVLEGPHAIELVRKIVGSTEPRQAVPGTIRGDFAMTESYISSDLKDRIVKNLVHASDSIENAKREISLWFKDNELCPDYKTLHEFYLG